MPSTPTGAVPATRVELAATLPVNDAGWTVMDGLIPLRAMEGAGQVIGSATLLWNAGLVSLINAGAPSPQTLQDLIGQYCRIQIFQDSAWTTVWTGVIRSQITVPDGQTAGNNPGGIQTFQASGLASILDLIFVNQSYVLGYDINTLSPIGTELLYSPIFNAQPSQYSIGLGERSQHAADITGGALSYYFDKVTPYGPWSAADIITYLLVGFAQPYLPPAFTAVGPQWVLSDPLGLLGYIPDKVDFDGKSLLECINNLINPRRGCTWLITVSGRTITITTYSTSTVALTAGTVTMPASTTTAALDTTADPFISDLQITQDSLSQFDVIEVHGNHPLMAVTLMYGAFVNSSPGYQALAKGWASGLEATWQDDLIQQPEYQNVFRRFVLKANWNGSVLAIAGGTAYGLRNALTYTTIASSGADIASFGVGGWTGVRALSFTSGEVIAPATMLTIDKFIPLPYGQDYSTTPAANTIDMTQPLLSPLVLFYDSAGGTAGTGIFEDLSDDYSIEVEQNPPAIVISGDAGALQERLSSATGTLLVTIGVHEADPMVVSWQNADTHGTHFVSEVPRVMVRRVPYCEQWVAAQNTIMGCSNSGTTAYALTSSLTVVDDTPKLLSWLAYLKSWYSKPNVTVSWTDHSQIDIAYGNGDTQPGALIATVNRGDALIPCGAIITTRAWDFTDANFGTTYTSERVIPDIDSIEAHPRVLTIWRSQQERLQE